jgi:hypothetical protein
MIKGTAFLYPKDSIIVCLRESLQGVLEIQIQSRSIDADKARWRRLPGAVKSVPVYNTAYAEIPF